MEIVVAPKSSSIDQTARNAAAAAQSTADSALTAAENAVPYTGATGNVDLGSNGIIGKLLDPNAIYSLYLATNGNLTNGLWTIDSGGHFSGAAVSATSATIAQQLYYDDTVHQYTLQFDSTGGIGNGTWTINADGSNTLPIVSPSALVNGAVNVAIDTTGNLVSSTGMWWVGLDGGGSPSVQLTNGSETGFFGVRSDTGVTFLTGSLGVQIQAWGGTTPIVNFSNDGSISNGTWTIFGDGSTSGLSATGDTLTNGYNTFYLDSTGSTKQTGSSSYLYQWMINASAATDESRWAWGFFSDGSFRGQIINDAEDFGADWLKVQRSGTTVTGVTLMGQNVTIVPQGSNGFSVTDTGGSQAMFAIDPGSGQISIWDGSTLATSTSGSFTTNDGKTVTVVNGIITAIA